MRSFKVPSRTQGEVTVVEDTTVPKGFGRFTSKGEITGTIARGSYPLPDKWDTMRLFTDDFDDAFVWAHENNPSLVIIFLDG